MYCIQQHTHTHTHTHTRTHTHALSLSLCYTHTHTHTHTSHTKTTATQTYQTLHRNNNHPYHATRQRVKHTPTPSTPPATTTTTTTTRENRLTQSKRECLEGHAVLKGSWTDGAGSAETDWRAGNKSLVNIVALSCVLWPPDTFRTCCTSTAKSQVYVHNHACSNEASEAVFWGCFFPLFFLAKLVTADTYNTKCAVKIWRNLFSWEFIFW